jgi:glycosyltransferase involved in cell wall biosynthesis
MGVPRVSVVMPVYNAAAFLPEALGSLCEQSFGDFEVVVVNDGSTDGSEGIIAEWAGRDRRIRCVDQENTGIIGALNRGIAEARGEYVARMDADDVSEPRRLERQVRVLDECPEVAVCGGWIRTFGEGPTNLYGKGEIIRHPGEAALVKATMLLRCAVAHPTVLMRRSLFTQGEAGGGGLSYLIGYEHCEDYALWARVLDRGRRGEPHQIVSVPEVVLRYRVHPGQISEIHRNHQERIADRVRSEMLVRWGFAPTGQELSEHSDVSRDRIAATVDGMLAADRWLRELVKRNEQLNVFDRNALCTVLCGRWVKVLKLAKQIDAPINIDDSPFRAHLYPGVLESL